MASNLIQAGGLISGIDTNSLVTQLVAAEKVPLNRLQADKTAKQKSATTLQTLIDKLKNLQNLAKGLASPESFNATSASVSTSGILQAQSDGAATSGSYGVVVAQLARAQRNYSGGFAAKDQAGLFGTGTLSITAGSAAAVDITIDGADTLQSVASKINAQASGVSASVIFDGTQHRLQVSGKQSGDAQAVTFAESGVTLGLSAPTSRIVSAQDAIASIDGFTVRSATNTLSAAIPGVTLTLTGVTAGASYDGGTQLVTGGTSSEVRVATDTTAMKDKVKSFVTSINDVLKDMKAYSASQKNPDSSMTSVEQRIRSILGAPVAGLSSAMSALNQLGVSTNRDGSMTVNETKLTALLVSDPEGVSKVLAKTDTTTGVASAMQTAIEGFVAASSGTLVMKKKSIEDTARGYDKRIDDMSKRLDAYESRMRKQFNAMEQALAKLNSAAGALVSTKV